MMRTCDRHTGAGLALFAFATLLWQPWTLVAQGPEPAKAKYAQISQGDLKESATENKPPMACLQAQVRVKRCGKSAPASRVTGVAR